MFNTSTLSKNVWILCDKQCQRFCMYSRINVLVVGTSHDPVTNEPFLKVDHLNFKLRQYTIVISLKCVNVDIKEKIFVPVIGHWLCEKRPTWDCTDMWHSGTWHSMASQTMYIDINQHLYARYLTSITFIQSHIAKKKCVCKQSFHFTFLICLCSFLNALCTLHSFHCYNMLYESKY